MKRLLFSSVFLLILINIMADNKERTFIMIKPDGVQRGLVGEIIKRFEAKGFKLVAMKMMWVSKILQLFFLLQRVPITFKMKLNEKHR